MRLRFFLACTLLAGLALVQPSAASSLRGVQPPDRKIPRYDRVFVIVEENHGYDSILQASGAPNLRRLAQTYGNATRFYAERHPSEPNYIAMVSGSTHGIGDDASFAVNAIDAPNLATQLEARGLSWGGYFGGYDPERPNATFTLGYYASKHNPFMNFTNLRREPNFYSHMRNMNRLSADLGTGTVPNFTFIVPGECDDMHGVPIACGNDAAEVSRGDSTAANIVSKIQNSAFWRSPKNAAIVITWDENDDAHRGNGVQGCCGALPGGGRIPTIVITNHGRRAVRDDTAYNHYSLLRTIEDAFGIYQYLGGADNWAAGIRPMLPLFSSAPTTSATAM